MKLRYKILLVILVAPLFGWSIFQANEYLKGNAFIPYLEDNKEVIALDESPATALRSPKNWTPFYSDT